MSVRCCIAEQQPSECPFDYLPSTLCSPKIGDNMSVVGSKLDQTDRESKAICCIASTPCNTYYYDEATLSSSFKVRGSHSGVSPDKRSDEAGLSASASRSKRVAGGCRNIFHAIDCVCSLV